MSYRPNPGTECCPGEVNRIMPNYVSRMWMGAGDGGLVAAFYGPSQITVNLGDSGQEVTIIEETQYPFSEQINFRVHTGQPVKFTLWLRIPGWCQNPGLSINGDEHPEKLMPGSFVPISRTFSDGDVIGLTLPMELKLQSWKRGGISIERGPVVFALRIDEDWQVDVSDAKSTPEFPAWNLYAASDWNYALAVDQEHLAQQIEIIQRDVSADPWNLDQPPIELRVPARKVNGWKIKKAKKVKNLVWRDQVETKITTKGDFRFTPNLPKPKKLNKMLADKVETITLVPYGCTHLRITIFPNGS